MSTMCLLTLWVPYAILALQRNARFTDELDGPNAGGITGSQARAARCGAWQGGIVTFTYSDDRQQVGRAGEDLAVQHLLGKGYELLARNWRCETGELDVVARDGACLVAVEVRTRRSLALGSPEESIDARKRLRLAALAEAYAQACGWMGDCRIDVVAIQTDRNGRLVRLEHYENAIPG